MNPPRTKVIAAAQVAQQLPAKVFVIQQQMTVNERAELAPKFDLEPAKQFGELVNLVPASLGPQAAQDVVESLWEKLSDYCDNDYLLLVGSPIFIGLSVAIASEINAGRVKLLQWQGREQKYFVINVKI